MMCMVIKVVELWPRLKQDQKDQGGGDTRRVSDSESIGVDVGCVEMR